MALFISGDRLSRYFPSTALEVFLTTDSTLLTQAPPPLSLAALSLSSPVGGHSLVPLGGGVRGGERDGQRDCLGLGGHQPRSLSP